MEKTNVRCKIAESILDKPWGFKVGGQQFFLYPVTLGQYMMTMSILESNGIRLEDFTTNALDTAMFMAKTKREDSLQIIAINLMKADEVRGKRDAVEKFAKEIGKILDDGDVATLIIAVLTYSQDRINMFVKESGLITDKNDLQRINNVKKGKNSFSFGGRTVYGQLIDAACERYGWTFEYVVWGISYINLSMMLQDQVTSVYLSDNELKHVHISNDREMINGDDPKNMKKIMEIFNE